VVDPPVDSHKPLSPLPLLRRQLQVLKQFIEGFDLVKMAPDMKLIARVTPREASVRVLSDPGRAYAIYGHGAKKLELALELPHGKFKAQWLNPRTGNIDKSEQLESTARPIHIASPDYEEDVAWSIRRIPVE
jgi:Putative collagen-binding domain of a collagenase